MMNFFTRIDPAKNISRFWLSIVTPGLLGGWSLIREWGRIGSPGTVQTRSFEHEEEARRAERHGIKTRQRHGYHQTPDFVSRWSAVMAAGGSIHAPPRAAKSKSKARRYLKSDKQGVFDF